MFSTELGPSLDEGGHDERLPLGLEPLLRLAEDAREGALLLDGRGPPAVKSKYRRVITVKLCKYRSKNSKYRTVNAVNTEGQKIQ